jgi:uncharacterized protein YqhQ
VCCYDRFGGLGQARKGNAVRGSAALRSLSPMRAFCFGANGGAVVHWSGMRMAFVEWFATSRVVSVLTTEPLALPAYGGQAVIEGVMMRGVRTCAVAMRSPSNTVVVHVEPLGAIYKSKLKKIPFLRGLVMLWDGLGLGMRALTLSANTQSGEDKQLGGIALYMTVTLSLGFGITLFFLFPAMIASILEQAFGWSLWCDNACEGAMRLSLLVGYLWVVGKLPNISRVFAYHGAEHQTINAFEAGAELEPESVAAFPLEHTRCGTAFLLTVVLLSILLFSLLGPMPWYDRLLSRLVMMPVLAGVAYEYTRWTAAHLLNPVVRTLVRPNLALQRLTTRKPSLDMLEVAIAAFQAMRTHEALAATDAIVT